MNVIVDLHNETEYDIPSPDEFQQWIELALSGSSGQSISVTIVEPESIQELNLQFRKKNKPTNVLSFPNQAPVEFSHGFIGDMVLCAQVIETEAKEQQKPLTSHWAHMVIHSTLHLLGFDHETDSDALIMETREIELMKELGFGNPYQEVENV